MKCLSIEPLEDRITPGAGDLDPTFGTAGVEVLPDTTDVLKVVVLPAGVAAIARQTDQTYIVVAVGTDGKPDAGFGTAGRVAFPGITLTALAVQPDGMLLVLGRTTAGQVVVTRLTTTGQLDPGFGANGTAAAPLDSDPNTPDSPLDVAIGPGGLIVAAGSVGNTLPVPTSTSAGSFAATRLMADGTIDTNFGANGSAVIPFPVGAFNVAGARAVAIQADGRVVLAGQTVVGLNGQFPYSDHAIVRLTTDGQLDATFGMGGRLRLPRDPAATAINVLEDVAVLPDNRILVAGVVSAASGVSGNFGRAARLLPDGTFDPTYGVGGLATGATPVFDAAIGSNGRVVFSGFTNSRLTEYGFTDSRFIAGGDTVSGAEQPDGQVVFAARRETNGTASGALVRVLGNGPPPGSGFPPAVPGMIMASGAFSGGGVQLLSPSVGSYNMSGAFSAFPGLPVTARSTTGDVTGDGVPDFVVGAGPGSHSQITVFDGLTYNVVADFLAFEGSFTGGVFVAVADLDGDHKAEVVISPDQGGGPRVVVFSVAGGTANLRASFFGFDDPNFRGGARVALGDVDNDGTPDLAVAAGFLGGPRVTLLDGTTLLGGTQAQLVGDFFAFPGADAATLRNGSFVAIGDVNGDGFADLLFGGGPGGSPRVFILNGETVSGGDIAGAQANPLANFFVNGSSTNRGGVRVAATNADGDARADLVVGSGEGSPASVRVYLGKNFTSSSEPAMVQDIVVGFNGAVLAGGVYVG